MTTESFVERGLTALGLSVERIAPGSTKTPDLIVSDGACTYLIEVKDKFPEPQLEQRRIQALDRTGTWEEEEPLGFRNSVSSVVREACRQLAAFEPSGAHFRLLWLHARGRHPDAQLEQFWATIMGSVDLIDLAEIRSSVDARPCYYFGFAEFFRHRRVLDGVFISTDEGGALCLNSLSARYFTLKTSILCETFGGVIDPLQQESDGRAYVADCNIDRSDSQAVLRYVRGKYGRPRLIEFTPTRYSAEAVVRRDMGRTRIANEPK